MASDGFSWTEVMVLGRAGLALDNNADSIASLLERQASEGFGRMWDWRLLAFHATCELDDNLRWFPSMTSWFAPPLAVIPSHHPQSSRSELSADLRVRTLPSSGNLWPSESWSGAPADMTKPNGHLLSLELEAQTDEVRNSSPLLLKAATAIRDVKDSLEVDAVIFSTREFDAGYLLSIEVVAFSRD